MTDRALVRALWVLLGSSMALSAVDFFRYDLFLGSTTRDIYSEAHVNVSMLLVIVITCVAVLMVVARRGKLRVERWDRGLRRILWFVAGFFLWHIAAIMWTDQVVVGLREAFKIAAGGIVLLLILWLLPRRGPTAERFWIGAIWGGTLMFGWLAVYSYQRWHVPLLSTEIDQQTTGGRNQLAWTLAYLIPFATAYCWDARWRLWRYAPFAVLSLVLLYSGSRGGGIATLSGLVIIAVNQGRANGWRSAARRVGTVIGLVVVVVAVLVTSLRYDTSEISRRWYYFYDPQAVPELHSYEQRGMRVRLGLKMAEERPIAGWGRGATEVIMGTVPHNDYVTVLAELGAVGFILLLGVIVLIAKRLFRDPWAHSSQWVYFGSQGAFVGLLVFMLTMDRVSSTTAFWIVMGMALATSDPEAAEIRGSVA